MKHLFEATMFLSACALGAIFALIHPPYTAPYNWTPNYRGETLDQINGVVWTNTDDTAALQAILTAGYSIVIPSSNNVSIHALFGG